MKLWLYYPLLVFIGLIGLRTLLWWLQCWQIREYRGDRMRSYFQTDEGRRSRWNLWFFTGILPRPKLSFRMLLMLGVIGILSALWFWGVSYYWGTWIFLVAVLLWERFVWLWVWIAVFLTRGPVALLRMRLFHQARDIIAGAEHVTRIAITGSFGKSSTKELVAHLLRMKFGPENVLMTPENENNEIAIARLILRHAKFFTKSDVPQQKFFVVEIGAYKKGEIKGACRFVQPQIGVLTGVSEQHMELFGSQEAITDAKFELAEACSDKVFYNVDNELLQKAFDSRGIKAHPIAVSAMGLHIESSDHEKTVFKYPVQKFVLPWAGKFFVMNAILAINVLEAFDVEPKELATFLSSIPPLRRSLHVEKHASGALVFYDLYSANPDGTLAAIRQLRPFTGMKIFIGRPLLELGSRSKAVHKKIFETLAEVEAHVFWLKDDFRDMGEDICGKLFHGNDLQKLDVLLMHLNKGDAVLLESRLPESVVNRFKAEGLPLETEAVS